MGKFESEIVEKGAIRPYYDGRSVEREEYIGEKGNERFFLFLFVWKRNKRKRKRELEREERAKRTGFVLAELCCLFCVFPFYSSASIDIEVGMQSMSWFELRSITSSQIQHLS